MCSWLEPPEELVALGNELVDDGERAGHGGCDLVCKVSACAVTISTDSSTFSDEMTEGLQTRLLVLLILDQLDLMETFELGGHGVGTR